MDDLYGNGVTTASQAAMQHYERAVDAHLYAWPGVLESLEAATAEDPDFALPQSLKALVLAARLAFTEALAEHLPSDFPWLMAYRGWARIETGQAGEGLAMARRAIALRPDNGHNAHIVLHGLFESGEPGASLDFVDTWLPTYPEDALMWGHLNWHAALSEIELEDLDAAVARLLGPIADYLPRGAPFMGLPDVIALLWRLGLLGVRGLPWGIAHEHAERHFPNGSNVFGERGHAGALVAVRWAQALIAPLDGDRAAAREHLDACSDDAVRLGGSHAQRCIVDQTRDALRLPS